MTEDEALAAWLAAEDDHGPTASDRDMDRAAEEAADRIAAEIFDADRLGDRLHTFR